MVKIDKLDRKIIAELDMNARIPITQLAKAVRASREVVTYRIKTLTKRGIISGTQTFFNPAKVGYTIYRVLVRLDSLDKEAINRFQDFFIKHDSVMWFAKLGGKWDYVVEFFAKNDYEFNILLKNSFETFEKLIEKYEVMTILEINSYRRNYILDNKKYQVFKIGGKIESIKLDNVDKNIIKQLKNNARLTNLEIGEKLGLARNTIKYRIKKLEETGIIQGYKLFYHPQKIGYRSYKLLISMGNLNHKQEKEFFSFAQQHKNIIFAHKNLGKWNYEFEIEIEDMVKLQEIIIELRVRFKESIIDYELFPILHDFKINLFPIA
jgi:Lrp/AsnC family leucine-responsive transcriptional regulator